MMLLANLNKYAVEHNLGTPFQERTIDFRLSFNDQGYVGMSVAEEGTKIRAAVVQRTTACVPYQFYDDPEFVLGVSDHGKRDRKTKEGLTAFEVFWQQAEKTLQGAGDTAALEALRRLRLSEAKWLSRAREYVQENFKPSGNKKKPYIALSYKSELLVDRPLVREYFEGLFADQLRRVDGPDTCLVTGDKCTAVKTHRQIAGVPGCSPAAAFISFSDMSSRLGRFSSDENVFPVSPPVMLRYTSALNSLLETNSAYVPADTCIVFWGPSASADLAKVVGLPRKDERVAREAALPDLWANVERMKDESADLHILCLKGSKGRISVVYYDIRPARDVAASALEFRDHFCWTNREGKHHTTIARSLFDMANSKMPMFNGVQRSHVIRSVLLGGPMPQHARRAIQKALSPKDIAKGAPSARAQIRWFEWSEKRMDRQEKSCL